jgi:hypothetical protein
LKKIYKYINNYLWHINIIIIITGEEFNVQYKNVEIYKLLNEHLNHNEYKNGLNIYGIHFIEKYKISLWLLYSSNFKYLCKISIPNNAIVSIEKDHFITSKIILDLNNLISIKVRI